MYRKKNTNQFTFKNFYLPFGGHLCGSNRYLAVAKQKKPSYKKIRKAIGQQLRYLKRNLGHIDRMPGVGLLKFLDKRLHRLLPVIKAAA